MSVDDEGHGEGGHDGDDHVLGRHVVVRAVSVIAPAYLYIFQCQIYIYLIVIGILYFHIHTQL